MPPIYDDIGLSAAPEQLSSKLGGDMVILNLQSGVYYGLNPVGARVWDLVREGKSPKTIRATLLDEFEVSDDVLNRDINEFLQEMHDQGIIQHSAPMR